MMSQETTEVTHKLNAEADFQPINTAPISNNRRSVMKMLYVIEKCLEFFHWHALSQILDFSSRPVTPDFQLPSVGNLEQSRLLGEEMEREWEAEKLICKTSGTKPKFKKVIVRLFWRSYMYSSCGLVISSAMRLCQPFFILKMLEQVTVHSEMAIDIWTSLMVVIVFLRFIFFKEYLFSSQKVALKLRIACSYIIFKKTLQKKVNDMGQFHPMNLLSNDVSRLEIIVPHLAWLLVGPLFIIGIIIIMYLNCHYMALISILFVYIVFIIISLLLGKVITKMRKSASKSTDKRLNLLSEIIGGIHIIKLYAWEDAFERLVQKARRDEVRQLKISTIVKSFFDCMHLVIDRFQVVLMLFACTLIDVKLMTHEIFGIILLLIVARTVVTGHLPYAFSQYLEFSASLDRIHSFLETDSVIENKTIMAVNTLETGSLEMKNLSASWKSGTEVLHYINLYLHPGTFCAIVGPVGSGKTSLLNAVLSELQVFHGSVHIGGTVSYAPQEPWIFHGTVRDNILFGEKFDQQRYDDVLRVCALKTDLEQLSHGDGTLVGERGVKLSGGQRARIGLARAVFKKADIYLLDDPLSAVDIQVSKRLFQECIMAFLQGKTRLLVTHHIQNLPHTDHVIVMIEGTVQVQGTFQEVTASGIAFGSFLSVNYEQMDEFKNLDEKVNDNEEFREKQQDSSFVKTKGHMASDVWKYINEGAGTFVFALYLIVILSNLVAFYMHIYLVGLWESVTAAFDRTESLGYISTIFYVLLIILVLTISRTVFGCIVMLSSSSRIHLSMVKSLLRTNLRFFHINPAGSIMAYFSDDIAILDEQFPRTFEWLIMISFWLVMNATFVGITNYLTWVSMIPLLLIICATSSVTTRGVNNFKNIEILQRGKYFSKVVDAIRGFIIIRALRKTEFILDNFNREQDVYTSSKIVNMEMRVAQNFILSICAAFVIASNILILMKTGRRLDPEIVGFGILFTMFAEDLTNLVLEHLGNSTSHFNSIKSCLNVTKLPDEEQELSIGNDKELNKNWPTTGNIEFVNVGLQYCEKGPFVLNSVSFSINSGEKIGVVGRTGAGKSSLVSALLRLAILKDDGFILVDSVDTRLVSLKVLRRSITVIPQDPVLFSGTVRDNLDPFNELEDDVLWNALKHVELSSHVAALDALVEERGSNWSVGQRQLLCLARASLRNSRILVLDEATASIDLETDKVIQTAIRRLFKDCTVVTIAHRLNTIMDSDRVLVIDSGKVMEFDSPFRLLENTNSNFYKLVRHSGKDTLEQMELIARKAYWTGTASNMTVDTRL